MNLLHLGELLHTNEYITIKRETLRKWTHDIHHVKPAKRRRSRIRKRRERMEEPGLMLQMDGSTHRWFGNKKSCLIAMIDDANSQLFAEFFSAETTAGCLQLLSSVVEAKGGFKTLYVDRAGIFDDLNVATSPKPSEPVKSWVSESSSPAPHKLKAE